MKPPSIMPMRALLAAALCLLAASCGGSDGDSPVPPDELTLINAFPNLGFERDRKSVV